MLLLKKDTFCLDTTSRLVKAADVAAVARIDEILESARKEGYEKGLEEGRLAKTSRQLDMLLESVRFMSNVEDRMIGVVLKALRKCIDEIDDETLVVGIVRKALKAVVRNQQQVTLRVSPRMAPTLKARLADLMKGFPTLDGIAVVEDGRMDDRSCAVESEAGTVEASVEGQFDAVARSLRRHFNAKD